MREAATSGFVRPEAMEFARSEEQQRQLIVSMHQIFEAEAIAAAGERAPRRSFEELLKLRYPRLLTREVAHLLSLVEEHQQGIADARRKAAHEVKGKKQVLALFESFHPDDGGVIDRDEFESCMTVCDVRAYGVNKAQLRALFDGHAVQVDEEALGEPRLVLNATGFAALLHSCGLTRFAIEMLARSRGLTEGTKFQTSAYTPGFASSAGLDDPGSDQLLISRSPLCRQPSLAERRNSVLRTLGVDAG